MSVEHLETLSVEYLEAQIAHTEQELEKAKSQVYRADGILQMLRHMLTEAKKEATVAKKPRRLTGKSNSGDATPAE